MSEWIGISQIITGFTAIVALLITLYQTRLHSRISKTDFLLSLRDAFIDDQRIKIYSLLRSGRKIKDWAPLLDYMGLFEVCEIMIKEKSMSLSTFKNLYAYRLLDIFNNDEVVFYTFIIEYKNWCNLYKLYQRVYPKCKKYFNKLINIAIDIESKSIYKLSYNFNKDKINIDQTQFKEALSIIDKIRNCINERF